MTKKKALLTAGLSLLLVLLVAPAASAQGTNLPTGANSALADDAAAPAGLRVATPVKGADLLAGKMICVDPGHGGVDSGAYNAATGVSESDINLDESYALRALLEGAGATVVMSRTGDQGRTESERAAFCNQAGATIVLSIHTNSFVDAAPNGALTFYGKRSAAEDMRLAQAVHDALYPALRQTAPAPADFTDFGVRRFGAGVLRRSSMPGTLVEPAFLSNPAEAALLAMPIFTAPGSGAFSKNCPNYACRRGQIAQGVYRGVSAYFAGAG
jgi:N-acetylmuramoyl-L-alanine amidase